MTLLMVWREGEADRLWVVSDSRLSAKGQSGDIRYTDRAAKVLEAQVLLHGRKPSEPPLQSRTVGFAYTGSTLIALEAYAAVLPLWSRLKSSGEQTLPSMGDCAEHLGMFLQEYASDIAGTGGAVATECLLLGHDDKADAVEVWRAAAMRGDNGIDLSVQQLVLGNGEMALFGSGKADAEDQLRKINPESQPWRRQPLDMLRAQLEEDKPGTVGGGVQVAFASPDGFHLSADAQPFRFGQSFGRAFIVISYRGFDFSEVSKVGHTFAALAGISG
ncbi:MAG: hypothetical protein JWP49_916 [Phenylobacterium sp.]|jgi:hypothetical protein|nr:hypothetical protein [Phenylobacterium sp.]